MKTIFVHVSDDGYMFGADDSDTASGYHFWHPAGNAECDGCTLEAWSIPNDTAEAFCRQGMTDQEYSDGYRAYSALTIAGTKGS